MIERRVVFDVVEEGLRQSIARVLARAGWSAVGSETATVRVSDDLSTAHAAVLVVDSLPATCRAATDRAVGCGGLVVGAVCRDELDELPEVLEASAAGLVTLSRRVIAVGHDAPPFSGRQLDVLAELLVGSTNASIARLLGTSEATVKREVASIAAALDARSRSDIVATATSLGYRRSLLSARSHRSGRRPAD